MRKITILALLSFSLFLAKAQEIVSPNNKIKIIVQTISGTSETANGGSVFFKILYKENENYTEVLPTSLLGLSVKNEDFTNALRVASVSSPIAIHDKYEMISGKRKICENFAFERTFRYVNANGRKLSIIFRAYNDGVAFRYELPGTATGSSVNITGENTTYKLPDSTERWMQPYNTAYEDFYPYSITGAGKEDQQWGFPALYKVNYKPVWVLISEAGNTRQNCGARLSNVNNLSDYQVTYPLPDDTLKDAAVSSTLPWKSQWHTLIIGPLPTLVASTLITDVSAPNVLKETSWIKPGAVSWVYWANNHGSKDYKKVIKYIDFAKEMGWPYALIDWEWDVMSNGGNVTDAINYAHAKGVKIILWYNSGTTSVDATPMNRLKNRDSRLKEFDWLKKIGVSGIKIDFFAGDQQDIMKFYLELLRDAAKYHLMVNFHGATLPRGWARTYPNLMSTEAVYGAEWYNNLPTLTNEAAKHNTTLPFTRNIVGSMDYTPVTFSNSQHPHITTYAHELALSVIFESALQHFADSPASYDSLPAEPKLFLKQVPTVWDDTKLLDGFPGKSVIIARRSGSKWYIGGLNGTDESKTLHLDLSFCDKTNLKLYIICDGSTDKSFDIKDLKLINKQVDITCLPRGGFVGVLNCE